MKRWTHYALIALSCLGLYALLLFVAALLGFLSVGAIAGAAWLCGGIWGGASFHMLATYND